MPAGNLDLIIEKGAKKEIIINYKDSGGNPISLASYKCRMQSRATISSTEVIFQVTTDPGDGIILEPGAETGRIDVFIGASITDDIVETNGVYDIELYNPGDPDDVIRLLEGFIEFKEQVTR